MLAYEDFNSHVEAHLLFALDMAHADGLNVFERRLSDGSWRGAASAWANKLGVLAYRATTPDGVSGVRHLIDEFVSTVVRCDGLDSSIREALVPVLRIDAEFWSAASAGALADWFARVGEPGDAGLAADMLDAASVNVRASMATLGVWLIDHGAAELRARSRLKLSLRLVQLVRSVAEPTLLLAAVRYVLENAEKIDLAIGSYQPEKQPEVAGLVAAIDQLLQLNVASPQIIADLARKYVDFAAGELLGVLAVARTNASVRRATLFALAEGLVPHTIASSAWSRVIREASPEPWIRFVNRESVLAALDALVGQRRLDQASEHEGAWANLVATQLLRFDEDHKREDFEALGQAVGYPAHEALDRNVKQALLGHLAERNPLAVAMLRSEFAKSGAILAALQLCSVSERKVRSSKPLEDDVARRLAAVLVSPASHRYAELGERLASCRYVTFEERLGSDFKVRMGEETLRVDRDAVRQLLDARLDHEELVVAGVLYVVHEVVHVCQHIDDKDDVGRLRSTGAETTLMHVDLGADHVAAVVVNAAIPEWSLRYLKDVVGRSLSAFPTASHHTTAARSRKANRLVGARLDFLAREAGVLRPEADEYAFAEYGPAGGHIVLMRSGPPWSLMGVAPLARHDANLLVTAADHGLAGLQRIDEVLQRALASVPRKSLATF